MASTSRLLCTFHDASLESAFRAHWARRRRHQDALLLSALLFAAIGLLAYLMSTGEAAARAVAFCPEGAAAAAGRIITAAERLSGHVGAAGIRAVVQHLHAAVEGVPLHSNATLGSKAAYTLAHAPQLLLYRVLVARDFLLGMCLVFNALFCARVMQCWRRGHWPMNATLMLFCASWPLMRIMQAVAWFPMAIALAPTAVESTFQQCLFTGIMAFWQRMANRAGVFLLLLFIMQPVMVHVYLPVAAVALLCNIVAPAAAALWAHADPFCNHAASGVVQPAAQLTLWGTLAKVAKMSIVGVLMPTAIKWVAERQVRAAFLLQHQQQRQQEEQLGAGPACGKQQHQQLQQHRKAQRSAEQPKVAASGSTKNKGAARADFSAAAGPAAAAAAEAVSESSSPTQYTQPKPPETVRRPTRSGNALYRSRFKTIVVSMKVLEAAELQMLETGGNARVMDRPISRLQQTQLPYTNTPSTSTNATSSLRAHSGRSTAVEAAAGTPAAATAAPEAAAAAAAAAAGAPPNLSFTTQEVRSAVVAAAQELVKTGQLKVAHIDCSCFPGCGHVVFGVLVDVDMDAAEQQQVAPHLVAASIEQLQIGHVQEAAELGPPAAARSPASASAASLCLDSDDEDLQSGSMYLQPVAVAAQQQQLDRKQQPKQQLEEEGDCPCNADVFVQLPAELVDSQAAAAAASIKDAAAVRLVALCCNSDTVLSDSSWTASEVLGCGGKLPIELPAAQLQSGLVHVLVLLHAGLAESWGGRRIMATPTKADVSVAHGHEVLVAKLPLLVLPSAAAAEEAQALFDCMEGQAGCTAVAYSQHFMPFAYDMAFALGCSACITQEEPAEDVGLALQAFMYDAPVHMPCCSQLIAKMPCQMPGGQTSSSQSVLMQSWDQPTAAAAQPCSSTADMTQDLPATCSTSASRLLSASQQLDERSALPVRVSLRQAVFGFQDAQLEHRFRELKPDLVAGMVLVIALMELVKLLIGLYKTTANAQLHPETLPWQVCYIVFHTSVVASHLVPLCCKRLRRHREACVIAGSVVTMAVELACHASQYMQDSAELGWRLYIERSYVVFTWRGVWLPLMQQLTMRNHLAESISNTVTYISIMWLLLHDTMSVPALAAALLVSQAVASAIALLSEWLWRQEFLRHCHRQQQQQQQQARRRAQHEALLAHKKQDTWALGKPSAT